METYTVSKNIHSFRGVAGGHSFEADPEDPGIQRGLRMGAISGGSVETPAEPEPEVVPDQEPTDESAGNEGGRFGRRGKE